MNPQDDDLRATFAALRHEEAARVATFRQLLAPALSARTPKRRLVFGPALLAAAVVVTLSALVGRALLVADIDERLGAETPVSLAAWTSPTAFLLHLPGNEVLSTVPSFASVQPDLSAPSAHTPRKQPRALDTPTPTKERNSSP